MKNFLILGLLALLLFSVSAALSLWLNQSKQQQAEQAEKEKEKDKEKDKALAKGPKGGEPKETTEAKSPPKTETPPPTGGAESSAQKVRERESKLEYRAAQIELVVRDLQSQREANDQLVRQVMNELKSVSGEATKLDSLLKDLNKKSAEINTLEDTNVVKLAAMYDSMSAEAAAPILKEMAEKGRMDLAAKIMAKMKERNSARVLEAMDPTLAAQMMDRMLKLRAPTPAPPPKAP